ncbi:LADA_0G14334g1_1 [Lachancea dasiensis]|uniref:LADA_0G14334g1_1 n=1 Tax=Lachancea dasiensis TaxID=1072105 RepID=A0A1G4JW50_9SACH|nr:LADA_0G14334g1_1 [Lachancea dasiensis]
MGEQEDISLPKATVQKIISEVLESDLTFSKEAREIIIESGIEFIMILSSMASEMADKEAKKTIAPDHVIKALQELEFHDFIPYLEQILVEHKETQRIKERRDAKFKKSGLSEEELLRQQEELFRQSRSRFHQTGSSGGADGDQAVSEDAAGELSPSESIKAEED